MTDHEKWLKWLATEQEKNYYKDILKQIKEQDKKFLLTPDEEFRFRPLEFSNINDIKIIITDTEPQVEAYAADGLSWSSLDGTTKEMELLYKKLYLETKVIYNQKDNSKDRWMQQGILLLNMELTKTCDKGIQDTIWEPFTISVLQYFLNEPQKRFFLFLDQQTEWNPLSNPYNHPIIQSQIKSRNQSPKQFFVPINDFISCYYGTEIDWR